MMRIPLILNKQGQPVRAGDSSLAFKINKKAAECIPAALICIADQIDPPSVASIITLDLLYSSFSFTLTENVTVNFVGGTPGQRVILNIRQDAVGSRLITWGPRVVYGTDFVDGSLSLTTTPNKYDILGFYCIGSQWTGAPDKIAAVMISRGYSGV